MAQLSLRRDVEGYGSTNKPYSWSIHKIVVYIQIDIIVFNNLK